MQIYFGFKSENPIGYFFSNYGMLGVDIFFVISGFVMYFSAGRSNENASQFMISRVFRIVPIYWFYTMLMVCCIWVSPNAFAYTSYDLKSLIFSILFIPVDNPSGIGLYPVLTVGWTLNFEMFFYTTLGLSLLYWKRQAIPLCFFVILLLPLVYPKEMAYSRVASSGLLYEFLTGFLIAFFFTHKRTIDFLGTYRRWVTVLAAAIAAASALMLNEFGFLKLPLAGLIVFLSLLAEPYINTKLAIIRKLTKLGEESYSTYLSHTIVITLICAFTGKVLTQASQLVTFIGIIVAVWIVSALSYHGIERNERLIRLRNLMRPV